MKNLFLIDGLSGTGKSDMVQFILGFRNDVGMVKKYTTRKQRPHEKRPDWKLDLEFVSRDQFAALQLDYQYLYGGHRYGFHRRDLEDALATFPNVFTIARNAGVIRQLAREFSFINVVPVFVYSDEGRIRERIQTERLSEEDVRLRLERIEQAFDDYVRHSSIYREIIINNSAREVFHQLIDQMLDAHAGTPQIDESLLFVLMKFEPTNKRLQNAYQSVKDAAFAARLRCEKLDEVPGSFKISSTAKQRIEQARLLVINLTGNPPNVFYELGYAHGKGKDFILIAEEGTPQLFYPGEYRINYYGDSRDLRSILENEFRNLIPGIAGNR